MEPEDPEPDEKTNVCPICLRDFFTVAGLRQHWFKGHTIEEIQTAVLENTQTLSQQSTPPEEKHDASLPSATTCPLWNKLQIKNNEVIQEFNIIENDAGGDCLFLSLMEFLNNRKVSFNNIPSNVHELRKMAVNYILSQDISRFKDSIIINLMNEIPGLLTKNKNDGSNDICKENYSIYMSTPGKYGTVAELCAISELFDFDFYVIRQNTQSAFTCYDYGSTGTDRRKESVHLLFTGNVERDHFRLLNPTDDTRSFTIHPGNYKLLKDYSSSRLTSIAPTSAGTQPPDENCLDDSIPSISQHNIDDVETQETSFDDFVNLLARCKKNIKILKRIPRGARVSAAYSLAKTIDDCLAQPESDKRWMNLMTFAYSALQVPDKTRNVSLATSVKKNISKPTINFKKTVKNKTPISISRRIECKIAEGDVKGAVKILSSNETLAPQNLSTLNQLKLKHPPPKRILKLPPASGDRVEHLIVSEKDVVRNINNFPNGSASGIDRLLPQHVKDLTAPQTGQAGLNLIKSITKLSNFMLSGKLPNRLSSIMYGASLCALNKEEGGIRPIAVGNTFRRLTAKLASASVRSQMSTKFAPRQVGFGTKGGCEAAAHATRTFIKKNRKRDVVVLKDGSQNGAQQVDPCGPLLFCSAIQAVVAALLSEFVVFYLDDGTIAGNYESVIQDFKTFIKECGELGLEINPTKCELFFCSEVDPEVVSLFNEISPGIIVVNELALLGSPITENAFATVFNKKLSKLRLLFARLIDLDNFHIAYYLLKNCLAIPKLVFLLRTSPTWKHKDLVDEVDNCIKSTLETLINSKLNHDQWILASLPVRHGGLGVRRLQDLALPAFLSSVNGSSSIVSIMLNLSSLNIEDISDYQDGFNAWQHLNPESNPPDLPEVQRSWDSIQIHRLFNVLQCENEEDKARFLAILKPESGAWLHALPSRTIGTLLDNNTFLIIVGLRLGADICAPHGCVCGTPVDRKGRHGLKCKKSAGRWARLKDFRAFTSRLIAG